MIVAPLAVINVWRKAALEATTAADAPGEDVAAALADAPKPLTDHVRYLRGTLTHLHGILLGTVAQASPADWQVLNEGLDQLAAVTRAAGDDGRGGGRA